jgi:predicted dehydrogenase
MSSMHGVAFTPRDLVRVGMIGLGGRGRSQLGELLGCDDVEVAAIADTQESALGQAAAKIQVAGQPAPASFSGEEGWRRLLDCDLDLVYITTG